MRQQGRLTDWNDDRGFGFITPLSGDPNLFVHVSEFPRSNRRPIVTDLVTYDVAHDDRGRASARGVLYLAPTRGRTERAGSTSRSLPGTAVAVSGVFLALLVALALLDLAAWVVPSAYVVLSTITYLAYGLDKRAAQKGEWRTQESALHLLAVAGGWPGALIAQRVFHHKTVKQPFQTVFWLTVVANIGLLLWLLPAMRTPVTPG